MRKAFARRNRHRAQLHHPPVHQGYIEPPRLLISVGADNKTTIWELEPGQFMVRAMTAYLTDSPERHSRHSGKSAAVLAARHRLSRTLATLPAKKSAAGEDGDDPQEVRRATADLRLEETSDWRHKDGKIVAGKARLFLQAGARRARRSAVPSAAAFSPYISRTCFRWGSTFSPTVEGAAYRARRAIAPMRWNGAR